MKAIFLKFWPIIILLVLSLLIVWPTLLPGFFSHQDDLQVMRIFEMRKCVTDLQIPCRWVPDLGFGNGFPLFNYYSPLPYYLGALFSFIFGFIGAAKILFLIPLVFGGISMYFLAKELFGKLAGFVAAVLYLFAPYRALDTYVRGDVTESFAIALIPLVFYFFLKLVKKQSRGNYLGAVISLGLFLLSHNIMVMLFLPILTVWVIYWIIRARFRGWPLVLASYFNGLGLAAFFLIPAFVEKNLVTTENLTRYDLNFRANFVNINQLFTDRSWGFGNNLSFQVGQPHLFVVALSIAAVLIGLIILKSKKSFGGRIFAKVNFSSKDLYFFILLLGLLAVSLFMTHIRSAFIWEKIGILHYAQFPWRFLALIIFSVSLIGGFCLSLFKEKFKLVISLLAVILAVVFNWSYFQPEHFYPNLKDPEKLSGEMWEQQSRAVILDYLPKKSPEPKEPAPQKPVITSGQANIGSFDKHSDFWKTEVQVLDTAIIEMPIFDFPNWRVDINGVRSNYSADNYMHRVSVKLAPGDYVIKGHLEDTQIRGVANAITLTSLMILVFVIFYQRAKVILVGKNIKYAAWVVIVLSIPTILALFVPGYFGAHDEMHIAWLYEMDQAVKMGQIPPRFVPDLSFGFGYPLFNFVFPLPFYLGELLHMIGFSLVDSIKGVLLISLVPAAYFMYRFLKEYTNDLLSITGAVIYTFAPYRAVDVYVRGAVGEALSFVFLPLIALSITKLTEDGEMKFNNRWIGIGALSLAALILCHNITAYMFIPFMILLMGIRVMFTRHKLFNLVQVSLSATLGLFASMYFWLPAILESSLVKYDTVYNFADHFPTLKQLVTPYWGYGASVPGPYDGMSFYLGTASLILILLALGFGLRFRNSFSNDQKILISWGAVSMLIAIFLMNFRASFLWSNLPFLPYFQFPWRFLIIATFAIPVFVVAIEKFKFHAILAVTLITFTVFSGYTYFHPQDFLGRSDQYFTNRYIPVPTASPAYYTIGEEYLRLPKQTQNRPEANYPLALAENASIIDMSQKNPLDFNFQVESQDNGRLVVNKYLFPGWQVKVDGKSVTPVSGVPFGQIVVPLNRGNNLVNISFKETSLRMIFDIISLFAIILAAYLSTNRGFLKLLRRNNIVSR